MGSGIQSTVKSNEFSSAMTVCRNGFHNGVMTYMLHIDETTIHKIFVAGIAFMEVIFSCLNLKPDDRYLNYNKPEVFNKTIVYRNTRLGN